MPLASAVAALLAVASGASARNVVSFDLTRGPPGLSLDPSPPGLSRRGIHSHVLINNITGGAYYARAAVGTPPQPVSLIIDSGSSDTWVVSNRADLCTTRRLQQYYADSCSATYDSSKSSTHKVVDKDGFEIRYLDGGSAAGDYVTDDFTIGDVTIKSLQIGHARQTIRSVGILGVGFSSNEVAKNKYPNIIDQLYRQGFIDSKAFSLYLNDRRSDTGNILFGGVDKDKFVGALEVIDMLTVKGNPKPVSFEIPFTAMSLTYNNGSSVPISTTKSDDAVLAAVLDSGTTLSYLPDFVAQQIYAALGAVSDTRRDGTGLSFVSCDYLRPGQEFYLTLGFGDTAKIVVPVSELVLDNLEGYEDIIPRGLPFTDVCMLGIHTTSDFESSGTVRSGNFALVGETFLRSAYVVYDLSHYQIGIAQANMNSTKTSIVHLYAADNGLPGLMGLGKPKSPIPEPTLGDINNQPGDSAGAGAKAMSRHVVSGLLAIATLSCFFFAV